MVSQIHSNVIKKIALLLKDHEIHWVLIGSLNLALQGVDVDAHDIDLLTDEKGAIAIGDILKDYEIEKVHLKETEYFKSYYGKFLVDGIQVEVMGDLLSFHSTDNKWSKTKEPVQKDTLDIDGIKIPVLSLHDEYEAYINMGRKEKAEKIKEKLLVNKFESNE